MRNGASGLGRILFKFCTAISTQTGCTGPAGVVCIPTITPSTRLFPGGSVVKNLPTNAGDWVWSLGQEDPLEKEMSTHCSILSWRIPWTEEVGVLWSMGLQRVGPH